jgi:hypothetical protein
MVGSNLPYAAFLGMTLVSLTRFGSARKASWPASPWGEFVQGGSIGNAIRSIISRFYGVSDVG